ncbi:hypothetical protein E2C01_095031 [Portunus trituberculatus]|uniref:Uncharacterized protein n=1 Tax=Portunus trituberculatus TaxID=210409 RepID=A0A5B7JYG5_PORTR|nr:hypothetical protein [Portunus trituberculatus]
MGLDGLDSVVWGRMGWVWRSSEDRQRGGKRVMARRQQQRRSLPQSTEPLMLPFTSHAGRN